MRALSLGLVHWAVLGVTAPAVGLVVYLRWVMDQDRGVEIVVDVVCLGFKVGNGYG